MANKQYTLSWAKIGNASGFRLSADFFKDHPEFKNAKGSVEMINTDTLLVRLQPQEIEQPDEDELMLSLFLDYVFKQALSSPDEELETYTEAMAAEDQELIAGVEIDY